MEKLTELLVDPRIQLFTPKGQISVSKDIQALTYWNIIPHF